MPYFLKGFEALLAYSLVAQADVNGMGVAGAPMTDCAGREFRRLWVDSSLTELLVSPSLGFPTHPFPLPDTAPYPAIEFFELGFAVFEAGEVTRPTPKIGVQSDIKTSVGTRRLRPVIFRTLNLNLAKDLLLTRTLAPLFR